MAQNSREIKSWGRQKFGTAVAIGSAQVEIKKIKLRDTIMAVTKKSLTTKKVATKPAAKTTTSSTPVAADKMVSALRVQSMKRINAMKIM
jgi:hypothetical protein